MHMSSGKRINPLCPYGNPIYSVCVNPQCKKPGVICENGASGETQCGLFHQNCAKIKWTEVQIFTKENMQAKTPDFILLQEKVQKMFLKALQKIQAQHSKFKIWTNTYGHTLEAMKFIKMITDGDYQIITGQYMANVIPQLFTKQNKRIQSPQIIQSEFNSVQAELNRAFEKIGSLYLKSKRIQKPASLYSESTMGSALVINSKILDDVQPIRNLFTDRTVTSIKLLYRASDNGFSIKEFHKQCDHIPNTLTLVKTQFDKVIGGYTPVQWTSAKKHWVADKSLQSFIFSLNMKEKFRLNLAQFAIASNPDRGPTFGCCDICVVDNSNKQKSNAQFPISYNNGKYQRSQQTSMAFTGHPKGQFMIRQWQIFQLQFD